MEQAETKIMTVKDWLITLLLLCIPLVNIVMLFVWAFGEGNLIRKNFAKAELIFCAILLVLYFLFFIVSIILVSSLSGY
ncbi:MAG: hypothetical protein ACI35R_03995 [Bacillus sp. (in: firmicutes)]